MPSYAEWTSRELTTLNEELNLAAVTAAVAAENHARAAIDGPPCEAQGHLHASGLHLAAARERAELARAITAELLHRAGLA
ncbi:MAG TPA: hypothetical protein VEH31_19410 [Streptosporangiaceae bacterium]|nr:hypothetical protein [Streptosporangiaceae bacterium]